MENSKSKIRVPEKFEVPKQEKNVVEKVDTPIPEKNTEGEKAMKELKIGERVTITLEVAEADGDSCKGCFFNHRKSCSEWRQYCLCSTKERLDRKNVIFKRIKK